jgi:type II secretory pathway pseudopilin PulG
MTGRGTFFRSSLAVLLALLLLGGFFVWKTVEDRAAQVVATETLLGQLESALEAYSLDYGSPPPTGNAAMVRALSASRKEPCEYIHLEVESPSMIQAGEVRDPWGHPLVYRAPTHSQELNEERGFELYSVGRNGIDEQGRGDDISVHRKR